CASMRSVEHSTAVWSAFEDPERVPFRARATAADVGIAVPPSVPGIGGDINQRVVDFKTADEVELWRPARGLQARKEHDQVATLGPAEAESPPGSAAVVAVCRRRCGEVGVEVDGSIEPCCGRER